jgi:hypothetical protein
VLTADPGIGVARHADAGYVEALAAADAAGIRIPMRASTALGTGPSGLGTGPSTRLGTGTTRTH